MFKARLFLACIQAGVPILCFSFSMMSSMFFMGGVLVSGSFWGLLLIVLDVRVVGRIGMPVFARVRL